MVILALETATRAGSLALVDEGQRVAAAGVTGRTHSERLPGELLEFVRANGRDLRDIDYFSVVSGPGSFTGLRIGLAAIQGLSMVIGTPVIRIPTMEALRMAWRDAHPGQDVRLVTCLDGARGDVFVAVFDFDATDADPASLFGPAALKPEEAAAAVTALPPRERTVIAGDGAVRYSSVLSSLVARATIDDRQWNLALGAALLARQQAAHAVPPHALRPVYVRRPDAELARERARSAAAAAAIASRALTIVRETKPEDLAAVAELQRRSFANAWGAEAIRWELDHSDVARLYTARTASGMVVAYCACWVVFDELHINSLAVDLDWRRQGVARELLDRVLRDATAAGVRGATLEVRQSNVAARMLYEGLGFKVEGVRRNYYQNPREDALILWRRDLGGRGPSAEGG
jgi:tRNA threonylcarbamoyladenosine biosynthesis protein TsaB